MRYRKLDASDDYVFGGGSGSFWADAPEAPAQAVYTRLNLWLAEWFADITDGTDWKGSVLIKGAKKNKYDAIIQARILGTPEVTSILAYSSIVEKRGLRITAQIMTSYSTTVPIVLDTTLGVPTT